MESSIRSVSCIGSGIAGFAALVVAQPTVLAVDSLVRFEAEDGQLGGSLTIASQRPGHSGTGYVTNLTQDGDRIAWVAQLPAGLYRLVFRYAAPAGAKGFELEVDGHRLSGMLPGTGDRFAQAAIGTIELAPGSRLTLLKGWGWYDLDAIEVAPAPVPAALQPLSPGLSDPRATSAAETLHQRLISGYGERCLGGVMSEADVGSVRSITGTRPAIRGFDLMDWSPSRIAFAANPPPDFAAAVIAAWHDGSIPIVMWHWNAPADLLDRMTTDADGKALDARWYKGFYTYATTFDLNQAVTDPASEESRLIDRDIAAIAAELRPLAEADVPILFRPLHEAEGAWFWWGARGPQAYIALWRRLYVSLTQRHGLHNLIWVYTVTDQVDRAWYPGDAFVDQVGTDAYPSDRSDPLSLIWERCLVQYDGRKLVALSEFGGVPDLARMRRFGVRFAWFMTWPGYLPTDDPARIRQAFQP